VETHEVKNPISDLMPIVSTTLSSKTGEHRNALEEVSYLRNTKLAWQNDSINPRRRVDADFLGLQIGA
jgi:hypothetical protein